MKFRVFVFSIMTATALCACASKGSDTPPPSQYSIAYQRAYDTPPNASEECKSAAKDARNWCASGFNSGTSDRRCIAAEWEYATYCR